MAKAGAGARRHVLRWSGAATLSYLANCATGLRASRRPLGPRARWVHHALYVSTSALTAGAAVVAVAARHPSWRPLALAAAPLILLPRFPGHSRLHPATAVSCAPCFGAALVLALRR